jgi:hypothetical protein
LEVIVSSRQDALNTIREYLADLLQLAYAPRPGDMGNADGLAGLATVAPLHQNATVSVRSGGIIARRRDDATTVQEITTGSSIINRETTSAPIHRLRVFVDVRHGQDEEAHHESVSVLLEAHPLGESRAIDDYLLHLASESTVATGDVFTTTFTGWLEFPFLEGEIVRDYPLLQRVEVSMSAQPEFVGPNNPLPVVEIEIIQEDA